MSYSWTSEDGYVIGGFINSDIPEWRWDRVHHGLGISVPENLMLRRNKSSLEDEFLLAEATGLSQVGGFLLWQAWHVVVKCFCYLVQPRCQQMNFITEENLMQRQGTQWRAEALL